MENELPRGIQQGPLTMRSAARRRFLWVLVPVALFEAIVFCTIFAFRPAQESLWYCCITTLCGMAILHVLLAVPVILVWLVGCMASDLFGAGARTRAALDPALVPQPLEQAADPAAEPKRLTYRAFSLSRRGMRFSLAGFFGLMTFLTIGFGLLRPFLVERAGEGWFSFVLFGLLAFGWLSPLIWTIMSIVREGIVGRRGESISRTGQRLELGESPEIAEPRTAEEPRAVKPKRKKRKASSWFHPLGGYDRRSF